MIDHPQADHGIPVAGMKFLFGDHLPGRGFGPEDAQAPHAVGQKDDREGQKSHAAEKMRLAAPEKQAVGNDFDIGQDGRAAGGIAGHHLEKSIGKGWDGPMKDKWHSAQRGDDNPAESGNEDAVFNTEIVMLPENHHSGAPRKRVTSAAVKIAAKSPSP
jgi:hypothetical protein